jgi:hypothetical protein
MSISSGAPVAGTVAAGVGSLDLSGVVQSKLRRPRRPRRQSRVEKA